jgi:hypothetical protein
MRETSFIGGVYSGVTGVLRPVSLPETRHSRTAGHGRFEPSDATAICQE